PQDVFAEKVAAAYFFDDGSVVDVGDLTGRDRLGQARIERLAHDLDRTKVVARERGFELLERRSQTFAQSFGMLVGGGAAQVVENGQEFTDQGLAAGCQAVERDPFRAL